MSRWLLRACAVLGIRLVHSTPGQPASRGKIERVFATVRSQFLAEAEHRGMASLAELNDARPAFSPLAPATGHTVCTPSPWINGVIFQGRIPGPSVFSFHPNATGQQNFATEFEAQI